AMAQRILGATRIALMTLDPVTEHLEALAMVGYSPEQESLLRVRIAGHTLPDLLADPSDYARLQAGETLMRGLTLADQKGNDDFSQAVLVPLCLQGHLIGLQVVNAISPATTFTTAEIALADGVAQLATLVIERERLARAREAERAHALALQEASRRMDTFLGIASHELKTPMTYLKGSIQLTQRRLHRLADQYADLIGAEQCATVQELLAQADQQMHRLERLVNDLLDVSRQQSDAALHHPQRCDLRLLVQKIVEELHIQYARRDIRWHVNEGRPIWVEADPDRISQVVTNYLTNALKYSAPDRPIKVRLQEESGQARLSVRDEGPGLASEEHERIWERFYRVDEIVVKSGSEVGLGLGLYLSRAIIQQHGGTVGV
ncbi:MAG TPA: HAMP domain-containing sensor histidine kinase, partial [Ktedonobacterales bacterium]|nr:HAMP domain-containing sensor histidine kinase [Ktedonobacterales bacterium]